MPAISIIQVTETRSEGRFDAEYFHPKYAELDKVLHAYEAKLKLGQLSNFVKKGIFDISPSKYRSSGVPLIRTTQIKTPISNTEDLVFIDKSEHISNHYKTELLPGDIMFTKIGAGIGDVSILSQNYPYYNFSQNVAGVSVKRDRINPYYLLAFLISKFGREQIVRYMMPSGQGKLELKDIKKIHILRLAQEETLGDMIKQAEEQINLSKTLFKQATNLLEQELGLDKISFEKPKSYISTNSSIIINKRSDAEFFNPELRNYYSFFETISGKRLLPITEYARVIKFSNPDYAETGTPIITQKHLEDISPEGYTGFPIASNDWVTKNPSAVLRENDLLFYSVGAYLGKTNIWFNEDKAVPASFITMLRCNNSYDAGYLMVLLNSKYGILQSKVFQSGTSQPYIYPKDIRQFLIPELSVEVKEKLYQLLRSSFDAKNMSKDLLSKAKIRVEQLIEEAAQN